MIEKRIKEIRDSINKNVELVAVSKTKSNKEILEAYNAGQKAFGENKIQEMTEKYEELPKDILENANLKFRLDTRYSITKLEMPFEPKRLNFNILSSNSVKFYCKGSCLLIHALGDSSISIASPSFEQIRLLPEQLGSTLEVELHAKAINFSIHVTSRIKSRIIMNLGSSDELYLLKKDFTNDYHVLSKLDSANPFFFPSEIIGYIDKFYGLLIERDSSRCFF